MDTFKLTGDTLSSVNKEPDEEEELLFAELYQELMEIDTRATRSRGIRVGGGKGLTTRGRIATSATRGVYVRCGSYRSSTSISRSHVAISTHTNFDEEGNPISEDEFESDASSGAESSSDNSLDS